LGLSLFYNIRFTSVLPTQVCSRRICIYLTNVAISKIKLMTVSTIPMKNAVFK